MEARNGLDMSTQGGTCNPCDEEHAKSDVENRNANDHDGRKDDIPLTDPDGRYRVLGIMTVAVVLGLSTWFSATAVR